MIQIMVMTSKCVTELRAPGGCPANQSESAVRLELEEFAIRGYEPEDLGSRAVPLLLLGDGGLVVVAIDP